MAGNPLSDHDIPFDSAAPGPCLAPIRLDKFLEAFEILFNPLANDPKGVSYIFYHPFRLIFHLQHDSSLLIIEGMKGHDPSMRSSRQASPRDPFVWYLFRYLSIELFLFTSDIRAPVRPFVVQLAHLLHSSHKPWKFFKLGPLIISRPGGHI